MTASVLIEKLLPWMRLTTPRSSRQDAPPAIDDLYPGCRACPSKLSRSDLVHWHISYDALAALKVRCGVSYSTATCLSERPESAQLAHCRASRRGSLNCTDSRRSAGAVGTGLHAPQPTLREDGEPAQLGRVEMWRSGRRPNISVAAPFVWRCLTGSTVAPFPHPAHRTGLADFPHPALGQDVTPSPTARCAHARSGVRDRNARRGARADESRPCVA